MLNRREVVETYVRYDARKKGMAFPADLDQWDWSTADAIDARLAALGFKSGIIAGYLQWDAIALSLRELANPDYSRRSHIKDEAGTRKCLYSEGV